jgi:type I restriction enzyme R subunit
MDNTIHDDELQREIMEKFGVRYPAMRPNDWRHIIEAYTPMVREATRPKAQELSMRQYDEAAESL